MWAIAAREFRNFFLSPLAWSILAALQIVLGWVFAVLLSWFLRPEVQSGLESHPNTPGLTMMVVSALFDWIGIIMLLVIPLLTMRLISEERRNKTLPLLFSAPVSMTGIVLGKFIGLMGFLLVLLTMFMLMPLSLLLGGNLDWGHVSAGVLGILLLFGALSAIGLFISTLTEQPTVAAIGTFGMVLLLWMLDWAEKTDEQSGVLEYLSITSHYQSLLNGLFSTEDVIYYLLVIAFFLILSIYRLDSQRLP
jgi:ABC-2 type transport system permease protein